MQISVFFSFIVYTESVHTIMDSTINVKKNLGIKNKGILANPHELADFLEP